jgi:MOSC domain-containing protein YiiM
MQYGAKRVATGGVKAPVAEAFLHWTNLDGDAQADLENHGGTDKAVCCYSFDHYPYWEELSGHKLEMGSFSENFTIAGVAETEICIGDTFTVGEATVQVSQPRTPCYKLAGRMQRPHIQQEIFENGFSGFYVRVLKEGRVRQGDLFGLVQKDPAGVTIDFANDVLYKNRPDLASLKRLLAVEALSAAWRDSLSQRI